MAVTGIGVISSIGSGREAFLAGLREGRCGTTPITRFDASGFEHGALCEVSDDDLSTILRMEDADEHGWVSRLAAGAARMAMADAGFSPSTAARGFVAVGTTDGESADVDELAAVELAKGLADLNPLVARRMRAARLSLSVAAELGLTDVEAVTLPNVCSAGNYAIGYGFDVVRSGAADFALCGGAETPGRRTFASFYRMGALARQRCQPFDLDRGGVVFGEGAAILALESFEDAAARGVPILAEVIDYHLNCDATHPTRPDEDTVAECMRGALRNAGVAPDEVDVVFAHGTATKTNDPLESRALGHVFGAARIPPLSAPKSMIGHTMGASAAHSCVAAILALRHGFIPPTINHRTPDPDCPVDCVPNVARAAEPRTALVNALGFGGANAAIVIRRHEDSTGRTAT